MWKVGLHELFDHMGPSLRRVGGILITPNYVRFRPEADINHPYLALALRRSCLRKPKRSFLYKRDTIQNLGNKEKAGNGWEDSLAGRERMDLIKTAQLQWMNVNISDTARLDEFFDHKGIRLNFTLTPLRSVAWPFLSRNMNSPVRARRSQPVEPHLKKGSDSKYSSHQILFLIVHLFRVLLPFVIFNLINFL